MALGSGLGNTTQIVTILVERAMGIEPTALCLGSRCSSTELRPLAVNCIIALV